MAINSMQMFAICALQTLSVEYIMNKLFKYIGPPSDWIGDLLSFLNH